MPLDTRDGRRDRIGALGRCAIGGEPRPILATERAQVAIFNLMLGLGGSSLPVPLDLEVRDDYERCDLDD